VASCCAALPSHSEFSDSLRILACIKAWETILSGCHQTLHAASVATATRVIQMRGDRMLQPHRVDVSAGEAHDEHIADEHQGERWDCSRPRTLCVMIALPRSRCRARVQAGQRPATQLSPNYLQSASSKIHACPMQTMHVLMHPRARVTARYRPMPPSGRSPMRLAPLAMFGSAQSGSGGRGRMRVHGQCSLDTHFPNEECCLLPKASPPLH